MSYGLRVDSDALVEALDKAPLKVVNGTHTALQRAALRTQAVFVRNLSVGVSGELRRSVTYDFNNKLSVQVYPSANYAVWVNSGTLPHWVSVGEGTPLRRWAISKGINPYALQKSIARKGTKASDFMTPVKSSVDSSVLPNFVSDVNKVVSGILE